MSLQVILSQCFTYHTCVDVYRCIVIVVCFYRSLVHDFEFQSVPFFANSAMVMCPSHRKSLEFSFGTFRRGVSYVALII